jgi:16S rRNA processing protein RimM
VIGKIVGLFGVHGWVKIYSYTRPREALLGYRPWRVRRPDGWHELPVADGRVQGKGLVARFEGIGDRDRAAELVGAEIGLDLAQLPAAGPGEYYWAELEGLRVVDGSGVELGTVSHLFETGANDVLVVRDGRRERLIPFTRDAVRAVDLARGEIRVEWDRDF